MYRVNLLGNVGYFKNEDEVLDFTIKQFSKFNFDTILKDFNGSVESAERDFLRLKVFNPRKLIGRNKMIYKVNSGVKMANFFMGFRYKLRAGDKKSIKEVLMEEKFLRKVMAGIFRLNRKTKIVKLRDFFTIGSFSAQGQKLGQFMPAVAKAVYETFCPEKNAKILDISAGFGGRLVGAMSSKFNYHYTGVDPSTQAIEGLEKLIDFIKVKDRARVIKLPFEDSDDELADNSFDFCFTSPPYFKKEIYSDEVTQSCHRYSNLDQWREGFLEKSFEIAYRKLRAGKMMLINIADVKIKSKKYPLETACLDAAKKTGFNYRGYKIMEMSRIPGLKRRFKNEKIFIFQKGN